MTQCYRYVLLIRCNNLYRYTLYLPLIIIILDHASNLMEDIINPTGMHNANNQVYTVNN